MSEIFEHKVYSVPPYMRDRTTCVIDVGANIGASALFFALAYPNAKIVCFEPNPLPLPLLHIKDMAPSPDQETCPFAEIGHGILDWDGIFAAAESGEVEWYIVEQDRCARPPMESARMSFEFLKTRGMA